MQANTGKDANYWQELFIERSNTYHVAGNEGLWLQQEWSRVAGAHQERGVTISINRAAVLEESAGSE